MDILSHGLWGGIIWGRKNRKNFWLSFAFGIAPDALSFGIFTLLKVFNLEEGGFGKPELHSIPQYIHTLYNITHSFVIFVIIFALAYFIFKRPIWEMLAWPFHIFLDMFTHSSEFFPTPFAWPFHHTIVEGIPWSTPIIFFTNTFFLVLIYLVYWYRKVIPSTIKASE